MTIDELMDNFSFLDAWEDRYKYLIELGGQLPHLDEKLKVYLPTISSIVICTGVGLPSIFTVISG